MLSDSAANVPAFSTASWLGPAKKVNPAGEHIPHEFSLQQIKRRLIDKSALDDYLAASENFLLRSNYKL